MKFKEYGKSPIKPPPFQISPLPLISAPFFQGKKVNKPSPLLSLPLPHPASPKYYFLWTDPEWFIYQVEVRIVLDPRLRDLQLLVLELFHLALWRTDAIVSKINKPAGELKRGFTVLILSSILKFY